MTISQMKLLCCVLLIGATLANSLSRVNFRASCNNEPSAIDTSGRGTCFDATNPIFSRVYNGLEQLNWDPLSIDATVREYWDTKWSFLEWEINENGENMTILTTACCHTAPFLISTLLGLETRPYIESGLYRLPQNTDLIIYNNTKRPRLELPTPPVQSIRNFINSRPSDESILIQLDLCRVYPEGSNYISDHHIMIHSYGGQINLYQSWQDLFTLIDWMTDAGSFDTRYPMAQDTFLDYLETFLGPAEGEEDDIKRRSEAIWALLGRTPTLKWKTRLIDGKERVDDIVVRQMQNQWVVVLATHWPNSS